MSSTLLLPPRAQLCNRSCSNKTHTQFVCFSPAVSCLALGSRSPDGWDQIPRWARIYVFLVPLALTKKHSPVSRDRYPEKKFRLLQIAPHTHILLARSPAPYSHFRRRAHFPTAFSGPMASPPPCPPRPPPSHIHTGWMVSATRGFSSNSCCLSIAILKDEDIFIPPLCPTPFEENSCGHDNSEVTPKEKDGSSFFF